MNQTLTFFSKGTSSFWKYSLKSLTQILSLVFVLLSTTADGQCWDWTCFENTEIKMNEDCIAVGNSGGLLVNPTQCIWGTHEITFFDPVTNADLGNTLGIEYLDQTLTYYARNSWTNDECYGTVTVVDQRGPDIFCENLSLPCTENYDIASIGTPDAVDNCTYVASLTHSDEVIDFGCGETGFTGYFAPENWEVCILGSTGDGGVDVTGAPNSISVEGAENSPVSDNCPYLTRFKIELPTAGYVTFDWSATGGSAFDHENAFFTIGDTCVQLTVNDTISGSFSSWLIEPGTWISFEVSSNGDADNMTAFFENFHFITPAIKVIHRTWTGYDAYGNEGTCTQIITLERALLDNVQFPKNRDGVEAPLLECGATTDPTFTEPNTTGYPFLDADGDLTTTSDQSPFIGGNECLMDVYHNDVILPDCDGNYTIARTWTIYDQCTETTREELQVIRVADTMAPEFTCPDNVIISTEFTSCSASFTVPEYTAVDACSNDLTYSSSWIFGNAQTTYTDITPGIHVLTLSAMDACGNAAECEMTVTVEDQVAPTVVCDAFTVAAVNSNGESVVIAEVIDDGSYDECCANESLIFEVKLADAPDSDYAPTATFDCTFLNGDATVNMRVTDCNGNSNFCTATVEVQDNQPAILTCPADMVIDCGTNIMDFSIFGMAEVTDNCGFTLAEDMTQNLNNCGVGEIIRSFTATDSAGNISECTQNISIENLTPWNANGDQINYPADVEIDGDCTTSVAPYDLPSPYDFPTYDGVIGCELPSWSFDDEVFYIAEPACYYVIRTWAIMDWCHDATIYTGTQTITVNDNAAPIFANPQTNISIELNGSNNCTATVNLVIPEVNDCSEEVEVIVSGELGTSFGMIEDIAGGTYSVTYTATDGCGNSAENTFTVTVLDNTVPALNCPAAVTVDCGTDLSDLTVYGMPTVTESCDLDNYTIIESVEQNLNDCGQGFIKRIWTITDENNNTSICEQFIYIENLNPWTPSEGGLTFPDDYAVTGDCSSGTSPDDLPANASFPTWNPDGTCTEITATYSDETIMIAPPNCYQINRTWTVSDLCTPGIAWTDVQTISVEDNAAPIFLNPISSYTLAPSNPANCTANIDISVPEVEECDPTVQITLTGDLTEGFGTYDLMPGVYDLTYTATDGCGNTDAYSYQITVVDNIAPTPICLSGLTLDIPASLELLVNASTFNAASNDNCTSFPNLNFSYSADLDDQTMLFTCEDLENTIAVMLYVTDEAGNQSSCSTNLQISDDDSNCGGISPPDITPDIFGNIFTWQSEPVGQVSIALENTPLAPYETTAAGSFEFPDMTQGNSYTLTPSKDINHLNGVTTIDAYMLSDHLTGIEYLDNGYQLVSGDADRSNDLTNNDITEIENAILFNESGFPNNTSWRFVDMMYIFPNIPNPLSQPFPESITLTNLQDDQPVYFVGMKIGDLNGTANPLNLNDDEGEDRDGDDLIFTTTDLNMIAGEEYEITFTTSEIADFVAYQFTLDFDPAALLINETIASDLPALDASNFGHNKLSEGALTSLWFNKYHVNLMGEVEAFKLRFKAQVDGKLSDYLRLNSRFTPALSYHKDKAESGVQLEFVPVIEPETPEVIDEFTLLGSQPNPFTERSTIVFTNPVESAVTFTFYLANGIELFQSTEIYAAGKNEFTLNRSDLGLETDALILYRMTSGDFHVSDKMMLIRQ